MKNKSSNNYYLIFSFLSIVFLSLWCYPHLNSLINYLSGSPVLIIATNTKIFTIFSYFLFPIIWLSCSLALIFAVIKRRNALEDFKKISLANKIIKYIFIVSILLNLIEQTLRFLFSLVSDPYLLNFM